MIELVNRVAGQASAEGPGDRIMKVNHAGEHGAVSIYTGQILVARLTARDVVEELTEFRDHEQRHRSVFAAELRRRGRRRCRSYWLCGGGGLMLGLVTGLLGRSAIAATTLAVESVVLRHLHQQISTLHAVDSAAVEAISSILADENEHHDRSFHQADPGAFWPKVLVPIVSAATEAVIWLGMRL